MFTTTDSEGRAVKPASDLAPPRLGTSTFSFVVGQPYVIEIIKP